MGMVRLISMKRHSMNQSMPSTRQSKTSNKTSRMFEWTGIHRPKNIWCFVIHSIQRRSRELHSSSPISMLFSPFPPYFDNNHFDLSSLPIAYNSIECNYLKHLIEMIVMSDEHCLNPISAINATAAATDTQSTSKKITKQRADDLLKEWRAGGYLYLDEERGMLTLGPRTIGEYGQILLQNYSDVLRSCTMCNGLALKVNILHAFNLRRILC